MSSSIRRFALFWMLLVVLLLLLTIFALYPTQASSQPANAYQEATPTPVLNIPTATPMVDAIAALESYGLQAQDLPANYRPLPGQSPMTPDAFTAQLLDDYPDKAIFVSSLIDLYRSYGLLGADQNVYFTESCTGQTVFGVATLIRQLNDTASAQALFEDQTLVPLYGDLFGWQPASVSEMGQLYSILVEAERCTEPSTLHLLEYPYGAYLVTVGAYVLDTTDLQLVTILLQNMQDIVNQRLDSGVGGVELPVNIPVAIAVRDVNIRRGPDVVFDPPIGAFLNGSTAQILALNLNDTWLKILYNDLVGWVSADVVSIEGDISGLPRESGPLRPNILNNGSSGGSADANSADEGNNTNQGDFSFQPGQPTQPPLPPQQPPQPPTVAPTQTPCVPPFCGSTPPPFPTAAPTQGPSLPPPSPAPTSNGAPGE